MALYRVMLSFAPYLKLKAKSFLTNEKGAVDIVAIVVLIGIAVLLALVFKDNLERLLESLFGTITDSATQAVGGNTGGD